MIPTLQLGGQGQQVLRGASLAWSTTRKASEVVLSNANRDASYPGGAAWRAVLGTTGHNAGLRQFEILPITNNVYVLPGAVNDDFVSYSDYIGSPTNTSGCGAIGYHLQSGALWYEHLESNVSTNGAHGAGVAVGDVLTVGLDFTGGTIKFYKNGTLVLTRSGFTSLGSKSWYPAVAVQNGQARVRGNGLAFPIASYTNWDD